MKKGLSLVELLIVMAIITILAGVSVVSLVLVRQNRQIDNVAIKLKTIFSETRSYALSPRSDLGAGDFKITIDDASNHLTILKGNAAIPNSPLISDTSIPSNIKFKQSYNTIINAADPNKLGQFSGDQCLILSDKTGNNSYYLSLHSQGEIDVAKGETCP